MATAYTASASSGYMTDVQFVSLGNQRGFLAHYSSPSNATGYVTPGMHTISHISVQDADPTTYYVTSNTIGGVDVYFSGLVTGSTGFIFIMGQ